MITQIFHLLGGQVVIGNLVRVEDTASGPVLHVESPHEVMATPSENSLKGSISFVPYGSVFGVLPAIVPDKLLLSPQHLVALPMSPPEEMGREFVKASTRLEEERTRITEMLKGAQTDITKDASL